LEVTWPIVSSRKEPWRSGASARGRAAPGLGRWLGQGDRIGDQQRLHRRGARRPRGRIGDPLPEADLALDQGVELHVQLLELVRGDPEQVVAVVGGLLPLARIGRLRLLPALVPGERPVAEQPEHGVAGDPRLRVVVGEGDAHPDARQPPGPRPALAAARLLDEAVLRELPQVERARGRRLADALAQLGGGQRAAEHEFLVQADAHRVREGAQRLRVGELPDLIVASHLSIVISRENSLNR
jgi:hypothetical protein